MLPEAPVFFELGEWEVRAPQGWGSRRRLKSRRFRQFPNRLLLELVRRPVSVVERTRAAQTALSDVVTPTLASFCASRARRADEAHPAVRARSSVTRAESVFTGSPPGQRHGRPEELEVFPSAPSCVSTSRGQLPGALA